MNKRKLSMLFILSTIFVMTLLYSGRNIVTNAAVNEIPDINYLTNYEDVSATKLITHDGASPAVGTNNSYVGETFTITINVVNFGAQDIYNVNVSSPESNLTAIGYSANWLSITGEPDAELGTIVSTDADSVIYTVTALFAGTYTFASSNITYSNDTEGNFKFFTLTNSITFRVFQEPPSAVVEKTIIFESVESDDARVKIDNQFFIKINITNYFYDNINATATDAPPGSVSDFDYNETLFDHNFTVINSHSSGVYQYNLSATTLGTYTIPECNVTYFIEGEILSNKTSSNTVELEVYKPIYEGNDWTLKVPMLSVSKYFQWNDTEKEILVNETKLTFDNRTETTIHILINVTNSGNVTALDIVLNEQVYNDWVFETVGAPVSTEAFNLSKGESKLFNYTITTKINGIFKIEPTEVTYSYINQETLLLETENKLFSNILELTVVPYIPETDLTGEWWATIGISFGIVALVAIPLVITFVLYSKRRRIQRGT